MLARGKSHSEVVRANGFSHAGFDGPAEAGAPIGEAIAQAVLCAFDCAGCGAAVVQLDGRLLGLNQRARAYLGNGLILSHGYLSAWQREGSDALQALLARLGRHPVERMQVAVPVGSRCPDRKADPWWLMPFHGQTLLVIIRSRDVRSCSWSIPTSPANPPLTSYGKCLGSHQPNRASQSSCFKVAA